MCLHLTFDGQWISIHALREESDFYCEEDDGEIAKISIHALREESDKLREQTMPIKQ